MQKLYTPYILRTGGIISVEFLEVVHPSVKGLEQALAVKQVSQNIRLFSHLNHL